MVGGGVAIIRRYTNIRVNTRRSWRGDGMPGGREKTAGVPPGGRVRLVGWRNGRRVGGGPKTPMSTRLVSLGGGSAIRRTPTDNRRFQWSDFQPPTVVFSGWVRAMRMHQRHEEMRPLSETTRLMLHPSVTNRIFGYHFGARFVALDESVWTHLPSGHRNWTFNLTVAGGGVATLQGCR